MNCGCLYLGESALLEGLISLIRLIDSSLLNIDLSSLTACRISQEFARWEDKFFEVDSGGYGKPVIRDKAVENDEQLAIATELKELMDGEMYIKQVGK